MIKHPLTLLGRRMFFYLPSFNFLQRYNILKVRWRFKLEM